MAIKSKNSHKIRGIKILAVILAVLTGGLALFSLVLCTAAYTLLETPDYTFSTLMDSSKRHEAGAFLQTYQAATDTRKIVSAAITVVEKYKNEDYYQNVYLPQEYSCLAAERETYIQEQIEQNGLDDSNYSYSSPEWDTSVYEETTVAAWADSSGFAGSTASGNSDRYQRAYHYWSGVFNLDQKYREIQSNMTGYLNLLESLINLKIYAVSREDGAIYTNLNTENPIDTIRALPFAMGYHAAPQAQTVEVYGTLTNTLLAERLKNNHYSSGTVDLYFGMDYTDLQGSDEYTGLARSYEWIVRIFDVAYPLLFVMSALFAVFSVLSICLAGRGPIPEAGTEEYHRKIERFGGTITGRTPVLRSGLDAIPNDLHLILGLGLSFGCCGYGIFLALNQIGLYNLAGPIIAMLLFSMAFALFFMELCLSVSRNVKAGRYWYRTVLAAVCRGIRRGIKRTERWFREQIAPLGRRFRSLPRYILLLVAGYLIVMIPLSFFQVLPVLFNLLTVLFAWRSIVALDRLMQYAHEIQSGNLNQSINLAGFPKWMLPFANDIIHLREGMKDAVEEALKSERMKTELITNVSHDLKTPLTSIITYTDLLGKCNIDDERALEYIGVLRQKSHRLKRLIEDLVEASKASTGNIRFNPVRLNLYEMAVQAVGEHEDTLAHQGITVLINEPETQPIVWADSQKTWRIIDNLFSNVRKYSAPGTRAYVDVRMGRSYGVFTIKNISREELNIRPEELMERFVRGDESRSSEGSGLGLSIAQNLCEKQGGRFSIAIDGDLFKATVCLPLAREGRLPPEPYPCAPAPDEGPTQPS